MPPLWVYCGRDPCGLYFREWSSIGCNELLKTASSVERPACGEQRRALQLLSVSLEKVRGWMSAENQREITRLTMYHPRYIELSLCGDGALIKSGIVLGWKTVWVLCMTNLSPRIILFNLLRLYVFDIFATLSNFELNGQFERFFKGICQGPCAGEQKKSLFVSMHNLWQKKNGFPD